MNRMRTARHISMVLALALVLALGALAGCTNSQSGSSSTGTKPASTTAKDAYNIAYAAVAATQAPDGKLLVCQAADTITATSAPIWEFLIGSPRTNVVYAVLVKDGKAQSSQYGSAGLSPTEWSAVPSIQEWKIDSPEAHDNALTVYPQGKDAAYFMGFVTYIPQSAKNSTSKPMTWIVSFDPTTKGTAATSTVDVNMTTGAATIAK